MKPPEVENEMIWDFFSLTGGEPGIKFMGTCRHKGQSAIRELCRFLRRREADITMAESEPAGRRFAAGGKVRFGSQNSGCVSE